MPAFNAPGIELGAFSFCLSVCDSVNRTVWQQTLTLAITFNRKSRDFILGMGTQLMTPFQMTPRSMTL